MVNRRNLMWTAIVAVVAAVALVMILFVLYRSGKVDRLIARQIQNTLAEYGIRAEIEGFESQIGPRTAVLTNVALYDEKTGAQLAKFARLTATIRIEDLFSLNLRRNVNLEALEIEGLEAWVAFDAEGRSNFANIRLPPPDPNRRILFSYSTARIKLSNAIVHYDDVRHDISGEARNLRALIQPDDPNAPEESRMNRVELALSDSTFVYDGRPIERISVDLRGRISQTRGEIHELVLRSPVAEARLEGTLDDLRNLRYQMKVNSTVDLTQASDVLQTGATLRGAGRFVGTVAGEGARYRVEGEIQSDAIAADNVRLKALQVNATGEGEGASYKAQGRAVAELLTAGDFQLNAVQMAGGVMGTGTDFRWVGDLRAAALRNGATSIAGLILDDATAEIRDGQISGTSKTFTATRLSTEDATVNGVTASGVEFKRDANGAARGTASTVRAGTVVASGATVRGVTASGVAANLAPDGAAQVEVDRVAVGAVNAAGAQTGTLNVAGVRLSIREGRVEGSSGDINVGTVAFNTAGARGGAATAGRAENVRVVRPVFVLEPNGRYRASADLSLGGGVLGTMRLGAARSAVVATNDALQLNNFNADIFGGNATGNATVSMSPRGASRVAANFAGVDVGGLLAAATGRVVPLTGAATGNVNLAFPGTNFKAASGVLNADFNGETGTEASGGRTPLAGTLALRADRGLFQIERSNLRAGGSEINASGQFSFEGGSNLQVNLASTDASELVRVVLSSGLAPELEETLNNYKVDLAGRLDFNGTLTGDLDNPLINGRASLASLVVGGRDLGSLTANIATDAEALRITEGQLAERDGGGIQFSATLPRAGDNNGTLQATLDRVNAGNIVPALAGGGNKSVGGLNPASLTGIGSASGTINVAGLPGAMSGSADLRVGPGQIGNEPFESLVARATFSGALVNVENLDARFRAGRVNANGSYNLETSAFDLKAQGTDVNLALITSVAGGAAGAPSLSGLANFNATATGNLADTRSYRLDLNAQGRDVTINGQPAGELSLVGRTTADQKFNLELTTGLLGQPQVVRAVVDLTDQELPATIETTLTSVDLTQLFRTLMGSASDVRVTGRATGNLRASGKILGDEGLLGDGGLGALQGRAEFTELVFQVEDVQLAAEQPLVVLFSPNEITFERTRFTGTGTNIIFGGTTALREGGKQNFTINGQLNLRVLNNLSPDLFLSGTARVGVLIAGSFADPRLTGTAEVAGASFSTLITDERLTVSNINGAVRFTADRAQIDSLTGRLGGGRVALSGGALLAGLRPTQFRLSIRADDVTVPFPNDFRSTADANLEVGGTLETQFVKGLVNLRRTEFTRDIDLADLINRRREAEITEGGGGGFGAGLQLDLQVEGRDALVVRNNLADAVGSISLNVRGSVDDPIVSGRVTASRGTLNFRNDRYELTRAFIDLPARRDADPILNIQAESEIRGYRVIVGLTGPLSQPLTTLRSDPALPQADVVSLITTGDLSSGDQSASTLAQTGLGTATSLLTDTLINSPVRRATDKLFGLNRFEIDPLISGRGGASPTARLTVGRQINRNLLVTYSTNVTTDQNQVIAVQYRVSDRLSFVAQYQQGAVNTLRPQQSSFNFEIRFRKRF
jgi:translocation and assembly module TamB